MSYVRLKNLSLNNQRFTPSVCKDIGIRKFEFVAKTQFLSNLNQNLFEIKCFKNPKLCPSLIKVFRQAFSAFQEIKVSNKNIFNNKEFQRSELVKDNKSKMEDEEKDRKTSC